MFSIFSGTSSEEGDFGMTDAEVSQLCNEAFGQNIHRRRQARNAAGGSGCGHWKMDHNVAGLTGGSRPIR